MADIENVIKGLENARIVIEAWIPMFEQHNTPAVIDDAIELLKKQQKRIEKLESDKGWDESPDMMGKW